jgi:hypothetical protein
MLGNRHQRNVNIPGPQCVKGKQRKNVKYECILRNSTFCATCLIKSLIYMLLEDSLRRMRVDTSIYMYINNINVFLPLNLRFPLFASEFSQFRLLDALLFSKFQTSHMRISDDQQFVTVQSVSHNGKGHCKKYEKYWAQDITQHSTPACISYSCERYTDTQEQ